MSQRGITISKFKIEYKYDEKKDCLVVCGKIDMQELADSNKDCALSAILKKFSDDEISAFMRKQGAAFVDDDIVDSSDLSDAVDNLNEISNHLIDIKVKYGLGADDLNGIIKELNERKSILDNKIKNAKLESKEEVKDGESKEVIEKSEQA